VRAQWGGLPCLGHHALMGVRPCRTEGASLLGCQTAVLGAAGAVRAGGAPRPLAAPGAICARPGRAGRQPRAALRFIFFFAKGRCPSRIRKTCSNCRCGTGPYTYVQALPRVHVRFWGRRQQYPRKATFRVGPQHREAPQARGEREHPRCRMAAEKTRPVENPCACVD